MREITFCDDDNPSTCQMSGQLTTMKDLTEDEAAFVKQVLDIFVRILRLWLEGNRSRQAMVTALKDFQELLFDDNQVTQYICVRNFLKRNQYSCSRCGWRSEAVSVHCPGCGRKIVQN